MNSSTDIARKLLTHPLENGESKLFPAIPTWEAVTLQNLKENPRLTDYDFEIVRDNPSPGDIYIKATRVVLYIQIKQDLSNNPLIFGNSKDYTLDSQTAGRVFDLLTQDTYLCALYWFELNGRELTATRTAK